MEDDPNQSEVSVEWADGRPVSIAIRSGWADRITPESLLREVQSQVHSHAPGAQRYRPSLGDVRLEDLREFAHLIREAREERHRTPRRDEVVSTYHFEGRWLGGRLLSLICLDPAWMLEAARTGIADELLEVCTPPPEPELGTAQRRLLRFVGKG